MYNVFYDQEFCECYKTIEECYGHIKSNYEDYLEDIAKFPEYYDPDADFPFGLYEILKNVAPDNLEDIVKNMT